MARKILFITTDQQRYDALGCNGGTIARTPVVDALAAEGIVYRRAYNQNTVCMPARSTMLTGQYVRTHGVFANGVALPPDAPSPPAHLPDRALRALAARAPPRAPDELRPAAQRARGRRHRRARDQEQPDPARVVPHRLGRRSRHRVARHARRGRRLVLLDELPRPPPSV